MKPGEYYLSQCNAIFLVVTTEKGLRFLDMGDYCISMCPCASHDVIGKCDKDGNLLEPQVGDILYYGYTAYRLCELVSPSGTKFYSAINNCGGWRQEPSTNIYKAVEGLTRR